MYQYVMRNVTKEGSSYRVRFQKKGKRYSKFFSKRKEAIAYRKEMLG
jgi:hypothetical protein